MDENLLNLQWNNHHSAICQILSTSRQKERYCDVTLSCGNKFYHTHKLVLSACSDYFERIFENTPCKHPVIVLKDIESSELEALLSYMYAGTVSVTQCQLPQLLHVAEVLQVKGLAIADELPQPKSRGSKNYQIGSPRHKSALGLPTSLSPPQKRRRTEENIENVIRGTSEELRLEGPVILSSPVRIKEEVLQEEEFNPRFMDPLRQLSDYVSPELCVAEEWTRKGEPESMSEVESVETSDAWFNDDKDTSVTNCVTDTEVDVYQRHLSASSAQHSNYDNQWRGGLKFCPLCSYSSFVTTNLKNHIRTHTGEKPYSCHLCQFSCIHRSNLKVHVERVHKLQDDKNENVNLFNLNN